MLTVKTPAAPPQKPSGFTAYKSSETAVGLYWYLNTRATGYQVEVSVNDASNFTLLGTTTSTSFDGNRRGTEHNIYVQINGDQCHRCVRIFGDSLYWYLVAPVAPSNLIATASSSTAIALTWQDNATSEKGFYVEQALSDAGPFTCRYRWR